MLSNIPFSAFQKDWGQSKVNDRTSERQKALSREGEREKGVET
jgi:hypothetical protein